MYLFVKECIYFVKYEFRNITHCILVKKIVSIRDISVSLTKIFCNLLIMKKNIIIASFV